LDAPGRHAATATATAHAGAHAPAHAPAKGRARAAEVREVGRGRTAAPSPALPPQAVVASVAHAPAHAARGRAAQTTLRQAGHGLSARPTSSPVASAIAALDARKTSGAARTEERARLVELLTGLSPWRQGLPVGRVDLVAELAVPVISRGLLGAYAAGADAALAEGTALPTIGTLQAPSAPATTRVRLRLSGQNPGPITVSAERMLGDLERHVAAGGRITTLPTVESQLVGRLNADGTFSLDPRDEQGAFTGEYRGGRQLVTTRSSTGLAVTGHVAEGGQIEVDDLQYVLNEHVYSLFAGYVDADLVNDRARRPTLAVLESRRKQPEPASRGRIEAAQVIDLAHPLGQQTFETHTYSLAKMPQTIDRALNAQDPIAFQASDAAIKQARGQSYDGRGWRAYGYAAVMPELETGFLSPERLDPRMYVFIARCAELEKAARAQPPMDHTNYRSSRFEGQTPDRTNLPSARIRAYLSKPLPAAIGGAPFPPSAIPAVVRMAKAAGVAPSDVQFTLPNGARIPLTDHPDFPDVLIKKEAAAAQKTAVDKLAQAFGAKAERSRVEAAEHLLVGATAERRLPARDVIKAILPERVKGTVAPAPIGGAQARALIAKSLAGGTSPAKAALFAGLLLKAAPGEMGQAFHAAGLDAKTAARWGGIAERVASLNGGALAYALADAVKDPEHPLLSTLETRTRLAVGPNRAAEVKAAVAAGEAEDRTGALRSAVEALDLFRTGASRAALQSYLTERLAERTAALAPKVAPPPTGVGAEFVDWLDTGVAAATQGVGSMSDARTIEATVTEGFRAAVDAALGGVDPSASADLSDASAKTDVATAMASAMMEALGTTLPPVVVVDGSNAAAQGDTIYVGKALIDSLDAITLAEIIGHEAGHVTEGHTGPEAAMWDALRDAGVIPPEMADPKDDERVADVYAGLLAYLFDGRDEPGISTWLRSLNQDEDPTHPASGDRADAINTLVDALHDADLGANGADGANGANGADGADGGADGLPGPADLGTHGEPERDIGVRDGGEDDGLGGEGDGVGDGGD
jgi:hypothetical protein